MTDPIPDPSDSDLAGWHRTLAPRAFNHTWSLLDLESRTRAQEEEMMAAAFAQRHHWYQVGDGRNRAIADWQVARVLTVLGYADLARRFAELSLAIGEAGPLDPFVVGFAHEAIARAAASVDDVATFEEHLAAAREQLGLIEDEEDREVLRADLEQFDAPD